jgi:hypothetical protein
MTGIYKSDVQKLFVAILRPPRRINYSILMPKPSSSILKVFLYVFINLCLFAGMLLDAVYFV